MDTWICPEQPEHFNSSAALFWAKPSVSLASFSPTVNSTSLHFCHQSATLLLTQHTLTPPRRPFILAPVNPPARCRPHSRHWISQLFLSPLTTPSSALFSSSPAPSCSLHQSCIQLTHCQSGLLCPRRPLTHDINLYQLSALSKRDKRQL